MSNQDQYGNYMPWHTNRDANENTNGNYHTSFGNPQISTNYEGQQQIMYGEYAEQSHHREDEYRSYEEYGAHEYYAGSSEKLRPLPLPPRRRSRGWIWYLLIPVLLFFLAGGLFSMRGFSEGPSMHSYGWPMMRKGEHHDFQGFGQPASGGFPETIPYNGSTLQININDSNGSVHIDSNAGVQQLSVNVQSLDGQNGETIPLNFDPGSGQLTFDASQFGPGYTIDIEVPSSVTHATVQVQDGSGDVSVSGISGQVNLESQDGSIELSQVTLSDQSSIKTQSGSIDFNGVLSPQGSYDFETTDGDVHLILPSDASFHLVNTPDNLHNDFNGSDVGSSPRPSLNVSSQGGDIIISQGQ